MYLLVHFVKKILKRTCIHWIVNDIKILMHFSAYQIVFLTKHELQDKIRKTDGFSKNNMNNAIDR